jgi:hypothetical protein
MNEAEQIVKHLLEDEYGPPAPDNFTDALTSMSDLMALERKKLATMQQLGPATALERQLRKHQITRDHVSSFIRADQKYPEKYSRMRPGGARGSLPPDAIVGLHTDDGREIIFDLAIMPERMW